MLKLSEHHAQACAPSMMLKHMREQCHVTHARTYVRSTHLDKQSHVEYRAQGGRTIYPTLGTKLTDRPTLRAAKCTHPEVVNG